MFDQNRLIGDCHEALAETDPKAAVKTIVARAIAEPAAVIKALGEPVHGGVDVILRSPELTILNALWPVSQIVMPHEHALWAVVGIYAGCEDNILWRRIPNEPDGRVEPIGALSLGEKDVAAFGPDAIHSVVNPVARVTAAIHVYGGDFFSISRSEWDPDSLQEKPYDMAKLLRMFAK